MSFNLVELFQLNFNLFDHIIFFFFCIFLDKGKGSNSRIFLSGFRVLADLHDFKTQLWLVRDLLIFTNHTTCFLLLLVPVSLTPCCVGEIWVELVSGGAGIVERDKNSLIHFSSA